MEYKIDRFSNIVISKEQKLAALYDICLKTGMAGKDASAYYTDPKLLGHIYAAPYAIFAAEYCLLLMEQNTNIKGYCIAALDSLQFMLQLENSWWPPLRNKYQQMQKDSWNAQELQLLEQNIIQKAAQLEDMPSHFKDYPSHLHIDLLPECQGQGAGKRLLLAQLNLLSKAGSCGVHLGVDSNNQAAIGFYHKIGFTGLPNNANCDLKDCYWLGIRL